MIKIGFTVTPYSPLFARARLAIQCGLLAVGLIVANPGYAEVFVVNSTLDEVDAAPGNGTCETSSGACTLRAAIQEANANGTADTIRLPTLPSGEYLITKLGAGERNSATGDFNISENLTIEGDDRASTIINGNGGTTNDRVFNIFGGATVTLKNLTIKGGRAQNDVGGGIYLASGTLNIDNCIISDNAAVNPGAAADKGNGGGIFNATSGILNIDRTIVARNVSDTNQRGIGGGGIFNAGALRIQDSTIDSNSAINSPGAAGGGIQNQGGTGQDPNVAKVTLINTTISRNTANIGGGIRNLYGSVNLERVTLFSNSATNAGGGVENSGGSMIMGHVTVHRNSAGSNGGGINNAAALDIAHSAIYDNSANTQGGGIHNFGLGNLNVLNTTITQNDALEGGGIYNRRELILTNATIYNNFSTKGNTATELIACGTKDEAQGLDCSNESSQVKTDITNTIIGNPSGAVACGGHPPLIISKGFNIDTGASCGFNTSGDKNNIFASTLFADSSNAGFVNNDGLTPNYAIFAGSAAHNAGDNVHCPIIDQRDYRRDTACDIGAYEISADKPNNLQLADLKVEVTSNSVTQGGGGQLTFTVTITNKGPSAATNVILTGKLPPWGMPEANGMTTNNAGTCSLTTSGFTCNLGTINAYASAQVYVVVFPKQEGTLILEADAVADQTDTFRPDSTTVASTTASPGSGNNVGGNNGGVIGNFSGKSGSVDWTWGLLLLIPAARRLARRP